MIPGSKDLDSFNVTSHSREVYNVTNEEEITLKYEGNLTEKESFIRNKLHYRLKSRKMRRIRKSRSTAMPLDCCARYCEPDVPQLHFIFHVYTYTLFTLYAYKVYLKSVRTRGVFGNAANSRVLLFFVKVVRSLRS
ncbi:hypothetical protein L596_023936 [Steinernema carpocapsae]|uniref:Uncharacterized protein n=1 Tax=Steinernema carpocapsae TaxID=34508 RepID=A0A4U5MF66_STECR|nr:hypothetical protein L596_023936 [Steinernema carpocapsae]